MASGAFDFIFMGVTANRPDRYLKGTAFGIRIHLLCTKCVLQAGVVATGILLSINRGLIG